MYQLYYYPGNANLAPHMLLEEIGVPYELVLVDRDQNAQRSPQYLKLNPNGRIPTLVDGDLVLFEAAAICLHLADRHPEAALAPALGTPARAEFYKWLIYLTNTLQAELLIYFYPDRLASDVSAAAAVKLRAQERVADMLDLIEQVLAQRAAAGQGPYLLGSQYSAADAYLLMLCRWTRMMPHPARARSHLNHSLQAIAARPAVARAFAGEAIEPPYF